MTDPKPAVRKVIIEFIDAAVMTLDMRDGQMAEYQTPEAAIRAIKKEDRKHGTGFDVTVVEWRNAPAGFTPPEEPA